MKPKLTGSSQLPLHWAKPSVHSRLSIVSAAHQWVSSQPLESMNGGKPGGYSWNSMNVEPPPLLVLLGAFESLSGVHGACGYEFGSHSAIENHGAGESSNQCATSWPGFRSVGAADGSRGMVSVQVTLLPEPCWCDRNVMSGSSWPMYSLLS